MSDSTQGTGSVSPQLDEMVCDLIASMLDALAAGDDPGVVLFAEDASANRFDASFTEDGEEACLEGARRFVKDHASGLPDEGLVRIERYAIAYTGCVNLEGTYQDALLVSFYERGLVSGFSAFVLFEGAGTGDGFMWSDPEPAGEERPLI